MDDAKQSRSNIGYAREQFRHLGEATANAIGTASAFFAALMFVALWAVTGPLFHYSDTWQLVINTSTTIVTFLIVFLIQSTQNRDTRILNLKLDELLRAQEGARTSFVALDHLSESDLQELHVQFSQLANRFGNLVCDDLDDVQRELAARRLTRDGT